MPLFRIILLGNLLNCAVNRDPMVGILGIHQHHSHLGTIQALRDAGLEVVVVAPATDWPSIRAVTEMALFPGLFRIGAVLATPIVWALDTASRAWWRMMRRLGRLDRSLVRPLRMTAGFRFVARRPTTEER